MEPLTEAETKFCQRCNKKLRRDARVDVCAMCRKHHSAEIPVVRAERTSETRRAYDRERDLRRLYGISSGEYQAIWDMQGGCCAMCGVPEQGKRLAVDHDHKSGHIRGLLCFRCNKYVLGNTTLEQARSVLAYLETPPAEAIIGVRVVPKQSKRKRRPSAKKAISKSTRQTTLSTLSLS